MSKKKVRTLEQKNAWIGRGFLLPFYLGFIFFFLPSLIQSISYIFSDVTIDIYGVHTKFNGLENLRYIFNTDLDFKENLINTLLELLWKTPVVLISSLLMAILINKKFFGRTLVRAIFFLPVIIASGVVMDMIENDQIAASVMAGNMVSGGGGVISNNSLEILLSQANIPEELMKMFMNISNNIFDVLFNCGIQMLIFLAALQSISPSLYEASAVEGASGWDNFWTITIPMILPMMLVNFVYTVVDSFTSSENLIMSQILENIEILRLGHASAILWLFCLIIGLIFGILFFIANRYKLNDIS